MQTQKYLIVMKNIAIYLPLSVLLGVRLLDMAFGIFESLGLPPRLPEMFLSSCMAAIVLGTVYNNERKAVKNPHGVVVLECLATAAPVVGLELMLLGPEQDFTPMMIGFAASIALGFVCVFHRRRIIFPGAGMITSMAISGGALLIPLVGLI